MTFSTARAALPAELRRTLWRWALLAGWLALAGYFLLPAGILRFGYDAFGIGAVLAIGLGILLHRPSPRRPWRILAAGVLIHLLGDLAYSTVVDPAHPFPSIGDAAYLAGTAIIVAATAGIGSGGRSRPSIEVVLDALLLAVTVGVIVWLSITDPLLGSRPDTASALVTAAYPVLDITAIAVMAGLILSGTRRSPSAMLLVAGLAAFTASDVVYTRMTLEST
jgi:diguanylate cyclase